MNSEGYRLVVGVARGSVGPGQLCRPSGDRQPDCVHRVTTREERRSRVLIGRRSDLRIEGGNLLVQATAGLVDREKILLVPIRFAENRNDLVSQGIHTPLGNRKSSRAFVSTILVTSSEGTSRNISSTTLRLLGQYESECG